MSDDLALFIIINDFTPLSDFLTLYEYLIVI
jgi:hypothetical protein